MAASWNARSSLWLGPKIAIALMLVGCWGDRADSHTTAIRQRLAQEPGGELAVDEGLPSAIRWDAGADARDWQYIVLHHSATDSGDVASIDAAHRRRTDASGRHWRGIGYHFLIGNGAGMPDGRIEATFRWREQLAGAHAGNRLYNSFGIGICLVGNFETSSPTPAQLAAVTRLIAELSRRFDIPRERVQGHGDLKATACPGSHFPLEDVLSGAERAFGRAGAGEHDRDEANCPGRTLPAPRFRASGTTSFRPLSAQDTEGIKHVVSISRARWNSTEAQANGGR